LPQVPAQRLQVGGRQAQISYHGHCLAAAALGLAPDVGLLVFGRPAFR
jgi:hypothetical protein